MTRKSDRSDILNALGKSMQNVASTVAKSAQDAAGVVTKGVQDAATTVVKEGAKAADKGAAAIDGAVQGAVDAVKNQQVISPEQMQELLDVAYSKALDGIPGASKPVEVLAEDYAKRYATREDAAVALINNQLVKCTTSGALSGLAGVLVLPVALASIPANIANVIYVQMRMAAALAVLGGYDVREDQVQTLVYVCMAGSAAADVLKEAGVKMGNKMAMSALKRLPGSALTAINQKVGFRLATKFGETGIVNLGKLVPVVGAVIGGGFDFATTRIIGTTAYRQFIGVPSKAVDAEIVDETAAEEMAGNPSLQDDPDEQTLVVKAGNISFTVPGMYAKLDAMPGDVPGSVALGAETASARCFLMVEPIETINAMPFDDDNPIIDGVHKALADDQGLIEVGHDKTKNGKPYSYSIIKTLQDSPGVQYALTLHMDGDGAATSIQGFFDEIGTTGIRDSAVFSRYKLRGSEGPWAQDPYDPKRTEGALMNISEDKEYDTAFPSHPLTLARAFVSFVAENN